MAQDTRRLAELVSIGPAMLRDFELLGIRSVAQLARQNPERLYEKLCRTAPQHQDICCLDVFRAAVAQARNPRLPAEQCQWWYWSRQRKEADSPKLKSRGRSGASSSTAIFEE
jgi:nucleotidyltransferase/DNA polymerase involved in DNA repair